MFSEYRRSLKMPAAEEIFDLFCYRPLAFLFVKIVYRTPLRPNQVTVLSAAAGIVAAWYLSVGTARALTAAAIWYAVANVLDCADGQLARLQQSGTLLGRVVDGAADYIASAAIFIGLGVHLSAAGASGWLLVIVTAASSALHAIFFDHYQSEYISTVRVERNFLGREIEQFTREVDWLRKSGSHPVRMSVLRLYLRYLHFQELLSARQERKTFNAVLYARRNKLMIRMWSLLGPTTNRTLLIISAFAGKLGWYFVGVAIVGNVWLAVCHLLQRRIQRRMEEEEGNNREAGIREGIVK